MKARVHIFFKESVFDPAGNTVGHSLQQAGFAQVTSVRIGKVIDLEMNAKTPEAASVLAKQMCERLLVNPVMESFHVEILD
jgi:phosphoribosylformylglycinamidine synthase subunit PurS